MKKAGTFRRLHFLVRFAHKNLVRKFPLLFTELSEFRKSISSAKICVKNYMFSQIDRRQALPVVFVFAEDDLDSTRRCHEKGEILTAWCPRYYDYQLSLVTKFWT